MSGAPGEAPGATPLSARDLHTSVVLLACATFLSAAAMRVCDSLLPRLATDFQRSAGASGQVIVGFAIAYGLTQLLFGPLGDRYGKQRMVTLALMGCALGAAASALAADFGLLVWARVGWGTAAAGVVPLAMAWIGDTVPYEERQTTLARLLLGTLSGMVMGQLLGGVFAESALGWRGAFWVLAAGYAVVSVLLWRQMQRMPAAAPPPAGAGLARLGLVLGSPWARVVLAAVAAEGVLLMGALTFLPTHLHDRHGMSLVGASALAALYAVGGLAYAVFARRIVAGLGEVRMSKIGGVLMGGSLLGWWLMPHWAFGGPFALLLGFGTYLFHNTLQTHATQMVPAARGTAVALFAAFLFGGQAVGVWLAGRAVDHLGYGPALLVPAVALPLAGWAFGVALLRRKAAAAAPP